MWPACQRLQRDGLSSTLVLARRSRRHQSLQLAKLAARSHETPIDDSRDTHVAIPIQLSH